MRYTAPKCNSPDCYILKPSNSWFINHFTVQEDSRLRFVLVVGKIDSSVFHIQGLNFLKSENLGQSVTFVFVKGTWSLQEETF
jgi:hypothetical protein